jgi:hypothetical protein
MNGVDTIDHNDDNDHGRQSTCDSIPHDCNKNKAVLRLDVTIL